MRIVMKRNLNEDELKCTQSSLNRIEKENKGLNIELSRLKLELELGIPAKLYLAKKHAEEEKLKIKDKKELTPEEKFIVRQIEINESGGYDYDTACLIDRIQKNMKLLQDNLNSNLKLAEILIEQMNNGVETIPENNKV